MHNLKGFLSFFFSKLRDGNSKLYHEKLCYNTLGSKTVKKIQIDP